MKLDNGTSDPVDYDQSGGGTPLPEESEDNRSGSLNPSGQSGDSETFPAAGKAPFIVTFTNSNNRSESATSCPFSDSNATVTLAPDWKINVSSGCD